MPSLLRIKCFLCRCFSQKKIPKLKNESFFYMRNIGVLAHIDAGKTTTTERMLFYAGTINNMGEVHHGNTVTDYMDEERRRGITIASVSVTFPWKNYCFNLVDTPGHIDFTMEVEQSLSVIDGAIIVLDSSAGVEAQTVTVWNQADRYSIPRIVYCNKMDRKDGSLKLCLETLESKLRIKPFAIQLPTYDKHGDLNGVINLISMERLTWNTASQGQNFSVQSVSERDGQSWEDAVKARRLLIDKLSDEDNSLADTIIETEILDNVDAEILTAALRRVTLARCGVPVLCGSAYKNIGVQLLMDAIVQFLPAPNEGTNTLVQYFNEDLCARAFKVIHDDQKRLLTFFRIYSGKINQGQKIYNITQEKTEQTVKIMIPYANDHESVDEISAGNIAVLSGLKYTMSGDLVTTNVSAANAAKKMFIDQSSSSNNVFGFTAKIPIPVFWCSIEPPSQAYQHQLEEALKHLQREDPSLQVIYSSDTGQTVLAGMGELHLDIIKNRIITEYKVQVELGPLQIAYKEALVNRVRDSLELSHKIGASKHSVKVTLSAWQQTTEGESVMLDRSQESAANTTAIIPRHLQAVKHGIDIALAHGPKLNCPMVNVCVMIHWLEVGRGTSDTIISAAVSQCLRKMFTISCTTLLEPIMQLEVTSPSEKLSIVLADLSRRRTVIQNILVRGNVRTLSALAPLAELLGYATDLRTISSGLAAFTMEFQEYQTMGPREEVKVIEEVTGFQPTSTESI